MTKPAGPRPPSSGADRIEESTISHPWENDDDELEWIIEKLATLTNNDSDDKEDYPAAAFAEGDNDILVSASQLTQWTSPADSVYVASGRAFKILPPGSYFIRHSNTLGTFFERVEVKTEGLLRFPQTNIERVTAEISKFWDREDLFRAYRLAYKRGILLWGPPGCGKSSLIQLIISDVVKRNGVVFHYDIPPQFINGYRLFRQVQPDTPVVVVMEDIDAVLEDWDESQILNMLDGIERIDKVVFIATTNYPEKLGPRIVNRPSRFDKRFKIGLPNAQSRKMYLESIAQDAIPELDKWVKDSEGFTLAHVKELFVAVTILGDEYLTAIKTLRSMKENDIGSFQDDIESEAEADRPATGNYI